jgi:N-acetylmuramoyl-L-alanine amidase
LTLIRGESQMSVVHPVKGLISKPLPLALLTAFLVAGCKTVPRAGVALARQGDEIVAAGHFFHTGTPVVLWMDPDGYDAYRVERRFSPLDKADWKSSSAEAQELRTPNRYNLRSRQLADEEIERVRGGGWDLPTLQRVVDQFVIHFDVCGVSRQCFNVLHDHRDLSVHFMLDLDGTVYQTLDLKERAWHATISNDRSIGIEIANMGAYTSENAKPLQDWYEKEANGDVRITIPKQLGDGGIRTKNFVGHPARKELVRGTVQGEELVQYDFTPQQYEALIKLTATLSKVFPKIKCDYPRGADGKVLPHKLADDDLRAYEGVLGHFHIQTNKTDPGPAFQWDRVTDGAQRLLHGGMSEAADQTSRGHMRN